MARSSYDYHFNGIKTVTKVEECTVVKWTYRFTTNDKGVTVNRVPSDNPLWSHGFYNDTYSISEQKWIPIANAGPLEYFENLAAAFATMTRTPDFYDGLHDDE